MKPYPNEELDRMSKREIIRLYKRTVEQFNDAVPVTRCKDCKHRPVYDEQKREMPPRMEVEYDDDGEPWVWDDDMTCPYLCGDSYYNQMPDDEQFCDRGERKEE